MVERKAKRRALEVSALVEVACVKIEIFKSSFTFLLKEDHLIILIVRKFDQRNLLCKSGK